MNPRNLLLGAVASLSVAASFVPPACADIVVRLPGQDEVAAAPKRLFIFNEKLKRITYVDLARKSAGLYEGRLRVTPSAPDIAESYRIGLPGGGVARYYAFSYLHEGADLIIDLEPTLITAEALQKSHPLDVTPKTETPPKPR